jgi:hypothetical protein
MTTQLCQGDPAPLAYRHVDHGVSATSEPRRRPVADRRVDVADRRVDGRALAGAAPQVRMAWLGGGNQDMATPGSCGLPVWRGGDAISVVSACRCMVEQLFV